MQWRENRSDPDMITFDREGDAGRIYVTTSDDEEGWEATRESRPPRTDDEVVKGFVSKEEAMVYADENWSVGSEPPPPPPPQKISIHSVERPPYAGDWIGGESFSDSICAGNFRFGATVEGDRIPLTVKDKKGYKWAAFLAKSDCVVETWSTSRGRKKWTIPAGEAWSTFAAPGVAEILQEHDPTTLAPQGQVDVLGRW